MIYFFRSTKGQTPWYWRRTIASPRLVLDSGPQIVPRRSMRDEWGLIVGCLYRVHSPGIVLYWLNTGRHWVRGIVVYQRGTDGVALWCTSVVLTAWHCGVPVWYRRRGIVVYQCGTDGVALWCSSVALTA